MGGFVDPFIQSPAWPQDMVFAGSSWAGSASPLAVSSAQAMMEFHLRNGSSPALMNGGSAKGLAGATVFPAGDTVLPPAKLHEQLQQQQQQQSDDLAHVLDFAVDGAGTLGSILSGAPPCPVSLTDSAPVICSSNESSGSEQSGSGGRSLPQFLMGERPAAWAPAYASISPMAGEETSRSFGFGSISADDLLHDAAARNPNGKNRHRQLGAVPSPQLQLHDDAEFNTGKLLSFAPGQQATPSIDSLQMNQKEFSSGLHHLNLSWLVPGPPLAPFNPKQSAEDSTGKNGNGVAGSGAAPKPRVRARRGQATDPHSIAERLRREKISDRMKNLQELVPNSNKTDKASMLEEIIEYIKFLQLQTKVLSMSRLGATEAVVPLLTESQNESSGLLLSPRSRSGERQAGGGVLAAQSDELHLEQEVAQLMENNMTAAMQYLQSKGICLMPIGLASAISTQKGTSSAAVRPEARGGGGAAGGSGDKDDVKRALHGLKHHHGSAKGMKSKMN